MRLSLTPIFKDAGAVAKGPQPHNLKQVKLDEFSLVTEPAILTSEESAAHKGFTVVKSTAAERVPESMRKSVTPQPGEDYAEAIGRLVKACRLALMAETGDPDCYYWFYPTKIYADTVLMSDLWGDPIDTVNTEKTAFYRCAYSQAADGSFSVSSVTAMKLQIVEAAPAAPEGEPSGVEVEIEVESVECSAPEAAAPESPTTEAPVEPSEPAASAPAQAEVERPAEPEAAAPEADVTPEPEAVSQACEPKKKEEGAPQEKSAGVAELLKGLSGKSAVVKIAADGSMIVEISEPTVTAPPATTDIQRSLEDERAKVEDLRKQLDAERLKQAKVEGSEPTGNPVVKSDSNPNVQQNEGWNQYMAVAMAQTRFG